VSENGKTTHDETATAADPEVERLRERIAALEEQLADQAARTNRAIAAAQERIKWLDRWQVDLNPVMERPAAEVARKVFRALRSVYRQFVLLTRRLRGQG
jgi:hypothetical protein